MKHHPAIKEIKVLYKFSVVLKDYATGKERADTPTLPL